MSTADHIAIFLREMVSHCFQFMRFTFFKADILRAQKRCAPTGAEAELELACSPPPIPLNAEFTESASVGDGAVNTLFIAHARQSRYCFRLYACVFLAEAMPLVKL